MSSRKRFTLFAGIACAFAAGAGSAAVASDATIALTGPVSEASPVLTVPTIALSNISTWQQQPNACVYTRVPMAVVDPGSAPPNGALGLKGPPGRGASRAVRPDPRLRRAVPLASVCCPSARRLPHSRPSARVTASTLSGAPGQSSLGKPDGDVRSCARRPAGSDAPPVLARANDLLAGRPMMEEQTGNSTAGAAPPV